MVEAYIHIVDDRNTSTGVRTSRCCSVSVIEFMPAIEQNRHRDAGIVPFAPFPSHVPVKCKQCEP